MDGFTVAITAIVVLVSYQAGRWVRRRHTTKCTRCNQGWLEP